MPCTKAFGHKPARSCVAVKQLPKACRLRLSVLLCRGRVLRWYDGPLSRGYYSTIKLYRAYFSARNERCAMVVICSKHCRNGLSMSALVIH
jgi:hypothetical protein